MWTKPIARIVLDAQRIMVERIKKITMVSRNVHGRLLDSSDPSNRSATMDPFGELLSLVTKIRKNTFDTHISLLADGLF